MAQAEVIQRTQVRRNFTKTYTELKRLLADSKSTLVQIKASFASLEDKAERLFKLDEIIGNHFVKEELDEKKIQAEFDTAEGYRENFLEARTLFEDRLKPPDLLTLNGSNHGSNQSASGDHPKKYRYPKLEFLKFDGNPKNWIGFWGMFEKVDKDDSLDDDERFQLLLQHMVTGSDAWKLVNSFPPSGKNYKKALDQLKSRFAKDEVLIDVYVRELLQLVLHQERNEKMLKLSSFYDSLVTQLKALDTLGVTSEKYAAMLYPLVEAAIPDDSLVVWGRLRAQLKPSNETGEIDLLKELLEFMKIEVESEERRKAARLGSKHNCTDESNCPAETSKTEPTAATLVATSTMEKAASADRKNCVFCKKSPHDPATCVFIIDWDLDKKREVLKKNGCCFSCLRYGHGVSSCRGLVRCLICKKRHSVVMCPNLEGCAGAKLGTAQTNKEQQPASIENSSLYSSVRAQTLLQTLVVRVTVGNQTSLVRALIDSGSQRSYLKTEILNDTQPPVVGTEVMSHGLFGGIQTPSKTHNLYQIGISGRWNHFKCDIVVLNQDKICSYVPRCENPEYLRLLQEKNISLTDTDFEDTEIKLLLGADVLADIVTSDIRKIDQGLTAVRTRLGWTVMGLVPNTTSAITICCANLNTNQLDHLWRLDVLGIEDPATVKTRKEQERDAVQHFEETVKIDSDNRYVVSLPWIDGHRTLVNNRETAMRRLIGTTRRLRNLGKREEYDKIFQEWEALGIIERVEVVDSNRAFYLPHHPVLKEASLTTKLRPVFDASAKDVRGNSLNACLEKGPNLVNLIPNLIVKFRRKEIGVSSDIARAFLQIGLSESDRDFLRFLWWNSPDSREIVEFRHCRVVFGVTSSPFLLGAVITHHLKQVPPEYRKTAEILAESWYVDNSVTSVSNETDLKTLIHESTEIMKMANFDLRGWVYSGMKNPPEPIIPLLGMKWELGSDFLFCDTHSLINQPAILTKRGLLSAAHKLFDPIGFTSPTVIIPKLLIQECWKINLNWESELPAEVSERFVAWLREVEFLQQCFIPRRLSCFPEDDTTSYSIHAFADASRVAYAACIFLRCERSQQVSVSLVQARARVAPLEKVTIPRLELAGALIASRLCREVRETLELPNAKEYLWSDSSAVITWIKKDENWSVFVANRCREIRQNTDANDWKHIAGVHNAADLPSRGCGPKALAVSKWWEGPEWLLLPEGCWPHSEVVVPCSAVDEERRKSTIVSLVSSQGRFSDRLNQYFSKFSKIVRCVAWLLRFIRKCRRLPSVETSDIEFEHEVKISSDSEVIEFSKVLRIRELSSEEVKMAEIEIWRVLQGEELNKDRKRQTLMTFVGKDGVVRVKTKLLSGDFSESFKTPVLVPSHLHSRPSIVQKMIFQIHVNLNHAGTLTLLCKLREEYWLTRRMVSQTISKCVRCKRFKAAHAEAPPAPLPEERIICGPVFSSSGVDLAGPLNLKTGEKAWIVLFTCSTYRAVHLELVTSLSTDAFLNALRRFMARRGRVETIFADNGTNFVGASNAMGQLDWGKIVTETSIHKIKWKFNPPSSPWWGGWWERLVRVLKELLRRNLGNSCLNYEELYTVLVDCESVINDRPLTYVSNDDDDFVPLSPSLFLRDIVTSEVSDLDIMDAKSLNKRVRYLQEVRQKLRNRFQKEYLALLVHRQKRMVNVNQVGIKVGDIVLVGSDNVKRISWPLAKVVEMFPGCDDHSRVARLKLASGELIRPIQRLYPLEVSSVDVDAFHDFAHHPTGEDSDSDQDCAEENIRMMTPIKKTPDCTRSLERVAPFVLLRGSTCKDLQNKPFRFLFCKGGRMLDPFPTLVLVAPLSGSVGHYRR